MQSLFDLTGKTALITGAWRGIGFALAGGLAHAGAKIIINGRDDDKTAAAVSTLQAAGYSASELVFDVTDNAATQAAIDCYEAEQGSIDIVINNAGIQHRSSLMDFESEAFEKIKGEAETIGGFVIEQAGRILKNNEFIEIEKCKIIVESSDKRRIKTLKVIKRKPLNKTAPSTKIPIIKPDPIKNSNHGKTIAIMFSNPKGTT